MHKVKKMYVLDHGVQYNDKSTMLAGYNAATFKEPHKLSTYIKIPIQTFLFECEEGYVLFDTACDPDYAVNWPSDMLERSPYEYPVNGLLPDRLKELGLTPEDINTVVMSHLHNDHAGCLSMFQKALVYVNDKEITTTLRNYVLKEPLDVHIPSDIRAIIKADLQWRTVTEEEFEVPVADGLTILNLGSGHSWGMLALRVDLENSGSFLLVSDALYSSENYGPPVHLPGIVYDTVGYVRTARTIEKYCKEHNCRILFGHDMEQFSTLRKAPLEYYD